jgi:hypothetical protein
MRKSEENSMRELTAKEIDMVSGAGGVFSTAGLAGLGAMGGYSFAKSMNYGPKGTAISVVSFAAASAGSGSSS